MSDKSDNQTASTYSDAVFEHLRSDIVGGIYAPNTKLAMKALSERFEVGASPIREALHRLAGEGLVDFVGQRGFRVPPLNLADLNDLTDLRLLLETAAVKQALTHGDDAWEAGLVAAFHQLALFLKKQDASYNTPAYERLHRQFHIQMYAGVVTPRLQALHSHLYDQAHRYRQAFTHEEVPPAKVLAEHKKLLTVFLARDVDAATAQMCKHLELTRTAAGRHLKKL
jgi:GntR family carbon starvation induced transcriptional regulator